MRYVKFSKVKVEFKRHIAKSFELIQKVNNGGSSFTQDQIYLIFELSFLRIFLAWEQLVEDTFIMYILGRKTKKGYRPQTYVKPKDEKHAYDIARLGRDYTDWTTPSSVIEKAELFFKDGMPYKDALKPANQDIQDMKTLRNAIVHMSQDAQEKFESLVRNKEKYFKKGVTPGKFLSTTVKNDQRTYISYFGDLLLLLSEKIIR